METIKAFDHMIENDKWENSWSCCDGDLTYYKSVYALGGERKQVNYRDNIFIIKYYWNKASNGPQLHIEATRVNLDGYAKKGDV